MKFFNLVEALKGAPVVTRSGKKVSFIAYDAKGIPSQQVLFRIDGEVSIRHAYKNGVFSEKVFHPDDLFMEETKKTVWVNLYPGMRVGAQWYISESEADRFASPKRIGGKAYPIEIVE
ncbi:hypothetical protein [Xenophilus sp. Marseille-Q4582]|uniref:hypothetical protein n=1 Tax=Xenophilus sp. Marseille-Q4582 TaxID=2866600 RepID=UPI001CE3D758|nr:hypothetical protein [Xenophilus sp. Marseille-Q4582]